LFWPLPLNFGFAVWKKLLPSHVSFHCIWFICSHLTKRALKFVCSFVWCLLMMYSFKAAVVMWHVLLDVVILCSVTKCLLEQDPLNISTHSPLYSSVWYLWELRSLWNEWVGIVFYLMIRMS
jgi:hypothetical protein